MRILLTFLCLVSPLMAQNRWNTVTIDVAGAIETEARGVNNNGDIVGFYRPSTSTCLPIPSNPQVPTCTTRGFKIVNGVLTKLNVPGATSTAIMGINDYDDLVGFYLKPEPGCTSGIYHGFIWYHQNIVKTIDYPNSTGFCGSDALWTVPMGINRKGIVSGTVWSPVNGQPSGGFVWKSGTFHVMNPGGPNSGVYGISNSGILVGTTWYTLDSIPLWTGFLKAGAHNDYFQLTQDDTFTTAVNNRTDIAGYGIYGQGFFAKHIGRGEGSKDPSFIALMAGQATFPFGMNDQRIVVGSYYNSDGLMHGFAAASRRRSLEY
jgi:hypothetical protein